MAISSGIYESRRLSGSQDTQSIESIRFWVVYNSRDTEAIIMRLYLSMKLTRLGNSRAWWDLLMFRGGGFFVA